MTNYHKGFKVDTADLTVVNALVEAFRPRVVARAHEKLGHFLAHTGKAAMSYADAMAHWHGLRFRAREGAVAPCVLTDFDLTFIFKRTYFLGRCISEDAELYSEWCRNPGVSDYSYWAGSNRPSHITEADWAERARSWSSVTEGVFEATEYQVRLMPDLALFRTPGIAFPP